MKINLAATLVVISCIFAYSQVKAEPSELTIRSKKFRHQNIAQNSSNKNDLNFVSRARDDRETNGNRKAGGNHGGGNKCNSVKTPVTALIPGKESGAFKLFTAQERPTFWFYIPYSSKLDGEFFVKEDKTNRVVHKAIKYPLTGQPEPSIVSIPYSPTQQPLELNKTYIWSFQVICDPDDRSADMYVSGKLTIVKQTPKLVPPKSAKPEQKAILYAKDGLWLETLTTIATELNRSNPNKAASFMKNLLQTYQLEKFADKPIVK